LILSEKKKKKKKKKKRRRKEEEEERRGKRKEKRSARAPKSQKERTALELELNARGGRSKIEPSPRRNGLCAPSESNISQSAERARHFL